MSDFFDKAKPILEKILRVIFTDRSKLTYSTSDGGVSGGRITAWRLEQAANNHLFDDHPERFGITEYEGHVVRAYFQESWINHGGNYLETLHSNFPKFMDEEDKEYSPRVMSWRETRNRINRKRDRFPVLG